MNSRSLELVNHAAQSVNPMHVITWVLIGRTSDQIHEDGNLIMRNILKNVGSAMRSGK